MKCSEPSSEVGWNPASKFRGGAREERVQRGKVPLTSEVLSYKLLIVLIDLAAPLTIAQNWPLFYPTTQTAFEGVLDVGDSARLVTHFNLWSAF